MSGLRWLRPAIVASSALLATWALLFGVGSPLQPALVFLFMLFGPGLAFAGLLALPDVMTRLMVGVALSLALDTIVAAMMIYTRTWSPLLGLLELVVLSLLGSALQVWRIYSAGARRSPPGSSAQGGSPTAGRQHGL